jgi:hypothetical protein
VYLKPNSYLGLCKRKRIIYGTKWLLCQNLVLEGTRILSLFLFLCLEKCFVGSILQDKYIFWVSDFICLHFFPSPLPVITWNFYDYLQTKRSETQRTEKKRIVWQITDQQFKLSWGIQPSDLRLLKRLDSGLTEAGEWEVQVINSLMSCC